MYLDGRRDSFGNISDYSVEDLLDKDASNLFSDPESEWTGTYKVEEPEEEEDDLPLSDDPSDLRPESERPENQSCLTQKYMKYNNPQFTFDS